MISNLKELQTHLTQERMAKREETSMADVLKMMIDMSTRDKQDRERREAEREQQQIDREEKRRQEQVARDEERRAEDLRREERRLRREQEIRDETEKREERLLVALKEAQPVVPQTVHLDNTKLPTMAKGDDINLFIEMFESAMRVGKVPEDKWMSKLHAALDMDTKLTIKEVITNAYSTYEELRQALVGQSHLTFTAASEAIMTLDQGSVTKVPMRQGIQKLARLFEKATAEATSIRETCLYSAVAVARFFLQTEVKQHIDIKGRLTMTAFAALLKNGKEHTRVNQLGR